MRKWIVAGIGVVAAAVVAVWGVFYGIFPMVSDPGTITVERSIDRITRGQYLANNVMVCVDCHTVREVDLYSMPPARSLEFGGGLAFTREMGVPGNVVSPNISPGALREWSDGEVVRAIASGVSRDGRVLFPIMPYHAYGTLDREDIYAVVAYLRVIPPVNRPVAKSKVDFPMNLIMRTLPRDPSFHTRPHLRDPVAYGRYLATAAGCPDCHTRRDAQGRPSGPMLAGGQEFLYPERFLARSANITPDAETGIGNLTKEAFIARFKSRTDADYRQMAVARGRPQTLMPWWAYSGMTAEDLGAIYDYLRTVPAVKNKVVTFEPR
ncbi:MAG: cytochrome C [Alphaproteobacteria bacterium]|nr:cytochrome C [Alphaproteobacteria bacterium]